MALNKKILTKVRQKTDSDPEMASFLMQLLEFESENQGWYKTQYGLILEKSCKEENSNANNEH